MSDRDFGNFHKYLDHEEKSYETVVYQQDQPLSSSELVMSQELLRSEEDKLLEANVDSGFLSGDFLLDEQPDYSFGTNADQFKLVNKPVFSINGWVAPLEYTRTSNEEENIVELPPAPSSSGEQAVDFVWLEAWRALLQPDPDSTNKPASDQVYRHGNVLSPSVTWLNDEMKDNPISTQTGDETTIRVQIQYRLRSQRLNTDSNRDGFSDDNVHPQGPNGSVQTSKLWEYAPNSGKIDTSDRGLWIAGDEIGSGNEVAGTADGFVYGIPVCLVYRRNSAGFSASSNGNGGLNEVESATPSDRPDGLFSDQIVEDDIQDLRKGVTLQGWNWDQVHERNLNMLLDNDLRSWATNSAHTHWYVGGNNDTSGTDFLMADDIVPNGTDLSNGNTIRNPDGICRMFTDKARPEKTVREYPASGSDWISGDTLTLDLTSTDEDVIDEVPSGTVINDVNSVVLDDSDGSSGNLDVPIQSVSGLGSLDATITIGTPPVSSQRGIWVEWEISYPPGGGLNRHPKDTPQNFEAHFGTVNAFESAINGFGTGGSTSLSSSNDVLQYSDISYEDPHREVEVELRTDSSKTITVYSVDNDTVVIPEYPYLDGQDPNNTITVDEGGTVKTIDSVDGRTINLSDTLSSGGVQVDVTYKPHFPIPKSTETTIYYRAPGIEAIPQEFLPTTLDIEPIHLPDSMFAAVSGSGSQGESFPWRSPSTQVPISEDALSLGEHELVSPPKVSIDDFSAETGLLKLQTMVPLASVSSITLEDPANSQGTNDAEPVDHFRNTDSNEYKPAIMSQPLSSRIEHKTFYPILAKLKEDTDFAKKGTVVMVIFSHYNDYVSGTQVDTEENRIVFNNDNSCAAVYKVKGNFLD